MSTPNPCQENQDQLRFISPGTPPPRRGAHAIPTPPPTCPPAPASMKPLTPRSLILGPGTFLGMPVLLCAGKGKKGACWAAAPESLDLGEGKKAEGRTAGSGSFDLLKFSGAICPVWITAKEVGVVKGKES